MLVAELQDDRSSVKLEVSSRYNVTNGFFVEDDWEVVERGNYFIVKNRHIALLKHPLSDDIVCTGCPKFVISSDRNLRFS